MDWVKISELFVAFFVPLSPYLIKYGEGIATELGKKSANKIVQIGNDSWRSLKRIISGLSENELVVANQKPENLSIIIIKLAKQLEDSTQKDIHNANTINEITLKIRGVIYDLILDGLLPHDLQELYLRMGVGYDDLVATTSPGIRSLVFSLVDYSSKHDHGLDKLIAIVEKTRPDLQEGFISYDKLDKGTIKEKLGMFLADKLTNSDLKEIHFRLGVSSDELIRRAKAQAIIEFAESRSRLPELVQNMWSVNPSLQQLDGT